MGLRWRLPSTNEDRRQQLRGWRVIAIMASSTTATVVARRVRASQRSRLRSTRASLSGVRTKNARNAATPRSAPATEGATSRPSRTGSRVRPHPPCSVGTATDFSGERARASCVATLSGCRPVPRTSRDEGPYRQSCFVASAAPADSVSSFAHAMSGWMRPPNPQSVDAITFSRPT